MRNVKVALVISYLLNVALFLVFLVTCTALVQERSSDVVRLTVWDDELLPTVRHLQGVTGKVAYAYPVDREEKHWRIVIDNRSEPV